MIGDSDIENDPQGNPISRDMDHSNDHTELSPSVRPRVLRSDRTFMEVNGAFLGRAEPQSDTEETAGETLLVEII